jgi:hypothetical protein
MAVDVSIMGDDMQSTGAGFTDVAVPPGGTVTGVALGVAVKERTIISGFEASQ